MVKKQNLFIKIFRLVPKVAFERYFIEEPRREKKNMILAQVE